MFIFVSLKFSNVLFSCLTDYPGSTSILGNIGNSNISILANVVNVGLANIKMIMFFTISAICIGQYCVQYRPISINAGLANIGIRFLTVLGNIGKQHWPILVNNIGQYYVQYWAMSVNVGLANIEIRFFTILGNTGELYWPILGYVS